MGANKPSTRHGIAALLRGKTLRDGLWIFVAKICGMAAGLLSISLLTRILNQNDMGIFLLLFALSGFLAIIIQSGLAVAAMKLIAQSMAKAEPAKLRQIVFQTLRLLLLSSGIFGFLWLAGAGGFVLNGLFFIGAEWSLVVLVWAILLAVQKVFSEFFRGFQFLRLAGLFDGAGSAVIFATLLVTLFVFSRNLSLEQVIILATFGIFITCMAAGILFFRNAKISRRVNLTAPIGLGALAIPIFLTEITVFFNNQADIWIVAAFLSHQDVAVYGVVLRLALLVLLPGMIVNAVIAPQIVRLFELNKLDQLERVLRLGAFVSGVPAVLALVIVAIFGKEILTILFGSNYAWASFTLVILCAGRVVNALTGSCGQCLLLCGHQVLMMKSTAVFSVLALISAAIAAQYWGIVGVACCFAFGMSVQNIAHYLWVKKLIGVSTLATIHALKSHYLSGENFEKLPT